MRMIDEQYLATPFYGSRRMTEELKNRGQVVNRKRIARLMRNMGLRAMAPSPFTSARAREHKKYPYLLKGLSIQRCNQVWAADITYVPTVKGYLYLVAILDWYSRCVLSWQLSDTLESDFCVDALCNALSKGQPSIFNTDQGVQFTSNKFTKELGERGIAISMDGKGHYWDNIIVERLWRTVKYEEVYLKNYLDGEEAQSSLNWYFAFYNHDRLHTSLGYRTPAEVYQQAEKCSA